MWKKLQTLADKVAELQLRVDIEIEDENNMVHLKKVLGPFIFKLEIQGYFLFFRHGAPMFWLLSETYHYEWA